MTIIFAKRHVRQEKHRATFNISLGNINEINILRYTFDISLCSNSEILIHLNYCFG